MLTNIKLIPQYILLQSVEKVYDSPSFLFLLAGYDSQTLTSAMPV